jgi:hypothetical protein
VRRALGIGAAVAAVAFAAPAQAGSLAAPKKVTAKGIGQVKVGATFRQMRRKHLVGKLGPGCPFESPAGRSSNLRSPLRGFVDWTIESPRRVRNVAISRGAKARGVGIGDTIADIKAKFPKAKVHHNPESVFHVSLVTVPKSGGGRIAFTVDVDTHRITLIGVPFIPFCD